MLAVIAQKDISAQDLKSELGDVLLQVIMHAGLASERGDFDFSDVVYHLQDKLITRLAPVFLGEKDPKKLEAHWQMTKHGER